MAGKIDLRSLPIFDPVSDPSSLSQQWKAWKRRFETFYLIAVMTSFAAVSNRARDSGAVSHSSRSL